MRQSDGVSAVISKDKDLIYFLDGNLSKICQISSSGLECYSNDFPAISICPNGDFVVATGHGVARLNIVNGNTQEIPPHYNNDFWVKDVAGLSNGDIGVVSLSCQGYGEEIECGEISYISQNKKFSTNDGSFMPIRIIELSNGTILCLSQKDSGLSFIYSIVLFDSDLNKLTTPSPLCLGNSGVTILKVVADNCFALALDDKTNTINFYDTNFAPMPNLQIKLDSPPVDVVYANGYYIVAEKDKVKNYTTSQILYKTDGDSGNITGLSPNPTNKNSVFVRTEKQYIRIDGLLDPAIPSGATHNVGKDIYSITALANGKFAVAAGDNNIYVYDSNAYWASTLTVNDSRCGGVISELQGGIIVTGGFGDSSNLYLHYGSGVNDLKRSVNTTGAIIKIVPAPIIIFPSTNFMYYVATSQNISLNILSTDSNTLTEYRKLLCFGDETIYDFIQLANNNVVVLTKKGVYLYAFNVKDCAFNWLATYKYSDDYENPFLLEFSKYILLYERGLDITYIGEAQVQLNKVDLTLTKPESISTYYAISPISINKSIGASGWGWRNKLQLNLLDENFNSLCYYQFSSVSTFAGAVGLSSGNTAVITKSYWAGGTDQVLLFNSEFNLINSKQFSCSPVGIVKLTNGNFVVATENGDLWVFDQNNMTQVVHSANTTFTDP